MAGKLGGINLTADEFKLLITANKAMPTLVVLLQDVPGRLVKMGGVHNKAKKLVGTAKESGEFCQIWPPAVRMHVIYGCM